MEEIIQIGFILISSLIFVGIVFLREILRDLIIRLTVSYLMKKILTLKKVLYKKPKSLSIREEAVFKFYRSFFEVSEDKTLGFSPYKVFMSRYGLKENKGGLTKRVKKTFKGFYQDIDFNSPSAFFVFFLSGLITDNVIAGLILLFFILFELYNAVIEIKARRNLIEKDIDEIYSLLKKAVC